MGWHCCVKRDICGSGWAGTAVLRETTVVADGLAGVKSRSCIKSSPGSQRLDLIQWRSRRLFSQFPVVIRLKSTVFNSFGNKFASFTAIEQNKLFCEQGIT